MKYMLLIYHDENGRADVSEAEMARWMADFAAYTQAMQKAGVFLGTDRLGSVATATTVRGANGRTKVLNGPYAETREQLGGYYMIDVPDQAAAISWAERCPATAFGTIEVRPVLAM
jgi:hypothetical protein